MFKFHKILTLSNKNKYAVLIIILVVSTFITVSATQSFIAEDTGLPTLFIIGVLQVSPSRTFEQFLLVNFEQFSSQIEFRGISNDDFLLGIE